jgi:hypothetical protein
MDPRLVWTLNGVRTRTSRDSMTTIPTVSAEVEAGSVQHRHSRALWPLVAVGPGLGLARTVVQPGRHTAVRRVIEALGVNPAPARSGQR